MSTSARPTNVVIRSYQVGFGDCFLMTLQYPTSKPDVLVERHILIDFGSTGKPEDVSSTLIMDVAKDIARRCGGKLDAVVATHRHADHISGFATGKGKSRGPGDIIAALKPGVVIQPWTEDPDAKKNAKTATRLYGTNAKGFAQSLANMQDFSFGAVQEAKALSGRLRRPLAQLSFIGQDNLANLSAVKNLQSMGKDNYYVYHGSVSGLEKLLPGVKTYVLGPPTLEQTDSIRKQRSRDAAEFWQFQANSMGPQANGGRSRKNADVLFPRAKTRPPTSNPARWFIRRMRTSRSEQLYGLVRILDDQMNNTSVILLFEIGKKLLLFPGDAQLENWAYALSKSAVKEQLKKVDVYKVGHHGSLNATPRSLWALFAKRSLKEDPNRLTSIVSTMGGKHGSPNSNTEVPRRTLVEALKAETNYNTTQTLRGKIFRDITIPT